MPSTFARRLVALSAAWLAAVPAGAGAAITVIDTPQFELRYDAAQAGPYGDPTFAGGTLVWFAGGASGLESETQRGTDATVASFSMQVQMKPGYLLDGVRMQVEGDWFTFGSGSVEGSALLRVAPVPGASVRQTATFAAQTTPSSLPTAALMPWQVALDASLSQGTPWANVRFQNLLFATAHRRGNEALFAADTSSFSQLVGFGEGPGNAFAFIDLKQVTMHFAVSAVPEPAGAALLLAGLGLVLAARRRGAMA